MYINILQCTGSRFIDRKNLRYIIYIRTMDFGKAHTLRRVNIYLFTIRHIMYLLLLKKIPCRGTFYIFTNDRIFSAKTK